MYSFIDLVSQIEKSFIEYETYFKTIQIISFFAALANFARNNNSRVFAGKYC